MKMKLILDAILIIVLVLLYDSRVLTLTFHEIAGLAIGGVILIHILLNRKWVMRVTRKMLDPSLPARTKVSYWTGACLLVCFLVIIVSGIVISKELFPNLITISSASTWTFWWKVHVFAAGLSLIITGIHIGLCWPSIKNFFRKRFGALAKAPKAILSIFLVVVLAWGVVSIPSTDVITWLASPFDSAIEAPVPGSLLGGRGANRLQAEAQDQLTANNAQNAGAATDAATGNGARDPESGEGSGEGVGRGTGQGKGLGKNKQNSEEGDGSDSVRQSNGDQAGANEDGERLGLGQSDPARGERREQSESISAINIVLAITQFGSIIVLFVTITVFVVRLTSGRSKGSSSKTKTVKPE